MSHSRIASTAVAIESIACVLSFCSVTSELFVSRRSADILIRQLVESAPFKGIVEMKRSTLAPRSKMLFTHSAIGQATRALLHGAGGSPDEQFRLAVTFWSAVAAQFPEWGLVGAGKMLSSELRSRLIHAHGVVLLAIAKAGNALVREYPTEWRERLELLRSLSWSREEAQVWEGRALVGGRLSKATPNVLLTANLIKTTLGLPLDTAEEAAEHAFTKHRTIP